MTTALSAAAQKREGGVTHRRVTAAVGEGTGKGGGGCRRGCFPDFLRYPSGNLCSPEVSAAAHREEKGLPGEFPPPPGHIENCRGVPGTLGSCEGHAPCLVFANNGLQEPCENEKTLLEKTSEDAPISKTTPLE